MNASVYLFGEFNDVYTQYPDDYTISIFKKFLVNAKSTTQIAIHRDSNLMYYSYIWKPEPTKYIGFCIVLNGLFIKDIGALFYLFENIISNLVKEDKVNFDKQKNLIISVDKLYQNQEEIELLAESLRKGINRFELYSEPLPAVSFGTLKDSRKDFVINDNQREIVKSSYTNGYTYIYGPQGFNPIQSNSDKPIMQDSNLGFDELKPKQPQSNTESKAGKTDSGAIKSFSLVIIFFIVVNILLYYCYNQLYYYGNDSDYYYNDTICCDTVVVDEDYYSDEDTYEDYYSDEDTYEDY